MSNSSMRGSRSLFYTTDVATLRELYPDNPAWELVTDVSRIVTF